MNVWLIYASRKLVAVVESIPGVESATVLNNWLGSCGLDPERVNKANFLITEAPVIPWEPLSKIWEPIPVTDPRSAFYKHP